ncbi:UDP-N-acetylmuramoyl-L-alanyl-D-glutamate--2,6-diaminopimelate ligase [Falsiporphyromonas endometrii]|uniref:UDP-N-acetylmuramoyl-L-alanyl-D-glutamate--2,6-diaminopimelate ligase n=1 Tax=Falsiporphyromonas endometrii TaxID=1387297 RepID=A0ABV9KB68_9PORP
MTVAELLKGIQVVSTVGNTNIEVGNFTSDSRTVSDGDTFIAVKGVHVDGHAYIDKAISQGAKCVILEQMPNELVQGVTYIQLSNTLASVGLLASALHGDPSKTMKVVGVTGTNGKTTIATLLYKVFKESGHKVGLLSTVCNYIDDEVIPATHTTPDPIELQALLYKMKQAGCEYVFMEVSSHAADQCRIAGIDFDGAVFTNLTRDHLDYHKTVDNYIAAKKKFFDSLKSEAFALVNDDDKKGRVMLQNCKASHYFYALKNPADFKGKVLELHPDSTEIEVNGLELSLQLVGGFNVYNALAVFGAATLLGMPKEEAARVLSMMRPVDGRFQVIHSARKAYTAVVDYAHTPDALVNVLTTINNLCKGSGRVICVVGAGGDRDAGKRPIMAKEAVAKSDILILTSDNPRSEDPNEIIRQMKEGLTEDDMSKTLCITDRKEAIRTACMMAQKGDFILVAGKGHETYQEVKGVKNHFDDREVIKDFMKVEK